MSRVSELAQRARKGERGGRGTGERAGRLLRRRNSKAGTYASFIKEIASKDCCFAHGYVSGGGSAGLPSPTTAAFRTPVIIIVSVPLLQQAFELRRVYIQFVSRNYNLSGIGARRCGRNRGASLFPLHAGFCRGQDPPPSPLDSNIRMEYFHLIFKIDNLVIYLMCICNERGCISRESENVT